MKGKEKNRSVQIGSAPALIALHFTSLGFEHDKQTDGRTDTRALQLTLRKRAAAKAHSSSK